MKNYPLLLLLVTLTGCGQVGPLYLPNGPAPIYVPKEPPEPKAKSKAEQPTPPKTEPEKN